jgi:LEA14-like dessication related protein
VLTAMGKTMELPVSHTGVLPVLRTPKFSNFSVKFSEVSFKGATVTINADATNPNIFALGVENLGYALSLGETTVGELKASTDKQIPAEGSGRITLTGRVGAGSALMQIMSGKGLGKPNLAVTGIVDTPYGKAKLNR